MPEIEKHMNRRVCKQRRKAVKSLNLLHNAEYKLVLYPEGGGLDEPFISISYLYILYQSMQTTHIYISW